MTWVAVSTISNVTLLTLSRKRTPTYRDRLSRLKRTRFSACLRATLSLVALHLCDLRPTRLIFFFVLNESILLADVHRSREIKLFLVFLTTFSPFQ